MKAALIAFVSLGLALRLLLLPGEGMIKLDCPHAGKPKLRINLGRLPLFLIAKLVEAEDPEASEFLSDIKAVKIRIYDQTTLSEEELEEVLDFYKEQLQRSEWEVLVRVRDEESTVGVYSLTKGDTVSGLVILASEREELVIVNLAGDIDVTRLSQVDGIAGVNLGLSDSGSGKEL